MSNENNIAPVNDDLNVVKFEVEDIKKKIHIIRGKQVMLDSDIKFGDTHRNDEKFREKTLPKIPYFFEIT